MFGLDDTIASLSGGASLALVILAAILLGLRHATDPDHLAAVTTLIASGKEQARRSAAKLGISWGLGHAVTLFAFGLPIVLFNRYLPAWAQEAAETAVAIVIVVLAVRLLHRWRAGFFHAHRHQHDGTTHAHLHAHDQGPAHGHSHQRRTPLGAFGIGLVHGMGGSAGVGILLVATIESQTFSVIALALLAVFTAVSMALLTTGFGVTLASRPVRSSFNALAPALGVASLGFGLWYGLAALGLAPYYF